MSLLLGVADRVSLVRSSLPAAEVAGAADRLRTATALLAAALADSSAPGPARLLAGAAAHLDAAAFALGRASDELTRYLSSVGVSSSAPLMVVSGSCPWADRVDVLTGCVGAARPGVEPRLSVVFRGAVRAASAGDRLALRRSLVSAAPEVGWSLAAHASRFLGAASPAAVQARALPLLRALLPGLSAAEGAALADRALRLSAVEVSAHPADAAAVGAVLVSAVLDLTGGTVESLVGEDRGAGCSVGG